MNIKCQYANRSKTSTLLTIEGALRGQPINILVDPGPGVDIDSLLEEDEYLTGVFLTHLHLDHYATLGENLRDGASVYTSQTNIDLLDIAIDDANQFIGTEIDKQGVKDSVTPIDEGVTIGGKIKVNPVPAGHTPGAIGFHLEIDTKGGSETILITGDFTRRPVAGYPGLPPVDADFVILTGVTDGDFESNLTEAVSTTIRQGLSGSPALVTATGLNAVHFASVLGTAIKQSNFQMGISVVGKAAKMLDALPIDPPNVTTIQEYEPNKVLAENAITITGPELPTEGGARNLFSQIKENTNAGVVLLSGDEDTEIGSYRCTLNRFPLSNHPTETAVDEYVELVNPREVFVTHQKGSKLRRYRDKYSAIVWAPRERTPFTLYRNGNWIAPHWVNKDSAKTLLNSTKSGSTIGFHPVTEHMPNTPESVNLEAEGIDMNTIAFSAPSQPTDTKYDTSSGKSPKPIRTDGAIAEPATAETPSPSPKPEGVLQLEATISQLEELKENLAAESSVATVQKVTDRHILLRTNEEGTQDVTAGDTLEISHVSS